MPRPSDAVIASHLEDMVREQAIYRENLEPLAARLGLSRDATMKTLAQCEERLAVLTVLRAERAELSRIMAG